MTAPDGYSLGVDLGTSNTVAVLRWPDGRSRPLLFDGLPVMPSAVYLADPPGVLHVGRDALRMAAQDPAGLEPNPKRRVDEGAVLLGGREVATVDLLAAVLGAVGRAAVEAVGFLPPAALTYPASWGPARLAVLTGAVARAGWPPVRFVPEPVAAARYFADVLRRPVPVGAALAVFDFGGGTLDIAVVRRSPEGFVVLGDGGIPDLGGVDVDAGLVDHLGALLRETAPAVWAALARPDTAARLRDRQRFWDDVRGAKEMLSRSPVAPVAVPGQDHAVHLTREELERIAEPLLRRAVHETAAVIGRCGLRPDQLAGLFLVGGSSRLPLVARLLHAQLGIAPTVLEQPELPVAEGATLAVSPAPSPVVYENPVSPAVAPAPPPPRRRPWFRKPVAWVPAAAVLVALAVLAGVLYARRGGPDQVNFADLTPLGRVPMTQDSVSDTFTAVRDDQAWLGYVAGNALHLSGYDVRARHAQSWQATVTAGDASSSVDWKWLVPLPGRVLAFANTFATDKPGLLVGVDTKGKETLRLGLGSSDRLVLTRSMIVLVDQTGDRLVGIDPATGRQAWATPDPKDQYGDADSIAFGVAGDLTGPSTVDGSPAAPDLTDDRIVQIGADKAARLIDATNGHVLKTQANVGDGSETYLAAGGRLYVADGGSGYKVFSYDLKTLGDQKLAYVTKDQDRRLQSMTPCGTRVCLIDEASGDDSDQLVAADPNGKSWARPVPSASRVVPLGDRVMVLGGSGDNRYTKVFGPDGTVLLDAPGKQEIGVRVTDGSVLLFSDELSTYPKDQTLTGYQTRGGTPTQLGQIRAVRGASCSWNTTVLICPSDKDFGVWRFAR